jgi:hypothetical protein
LSAGALLGCAGAGNTTGSGGSKGSGGSSSSGGNTGSGGNNNSGGNNGSGGSSSSGGNSASGGNGSGGSVSSGGNTGSGGSNNSGGSTGSGGNSSGGSTGSGGSSPVSDAGSDAACQMADFKFQPQIPTVYLLVDRSGSMFHCLDSSNPVCDNQMDTSWYTLKTAIESVIKNLDSTVRFGFTTIWGTNPMGSGGMCPSLQGTLTDNVAPALNNAATITAKYDGLAWPTASGSSTPGMKFESPASESIGNVAAALMKDTDPGPKYIIFLTDGQPDYCDDSLAVCAIDSVIYHLQVASMAGIKTIVFGIQTTQFDLPAGTLQAFANAGANEPTLAPLASGLDVNAFFDQCSNGNVAGWLADLKAAGKSDTRGVSLGTYMSTMGPTKPYQPSASDQTMLTNQLSMALAGVKSCSFDLSDINGKSIKVDTTMLGKASIAIQGNPIPQDSTNGWSVSGTTTLLLNGSACTTWQTPGNDDIMFNFPCSTIIFE